MNNDNFFVLLEAKEHMISEVTKKSKFVFLFSCLVTITLCFFNKSELYSIFGLIRINDSIPILILIPAAMVITTYHFVLYMHNYSESITAWNNKKNNCKDSFEELKKQRKIETSYKTKNEMLFMSFHHLSIDLVNLKEKYTSIEYTSPKEKFQSRLDNFANLLDSCEETLSLENRFFEKIEFHESYHIDDKETLRKYVKIIDRALKDYDPSSSQKTIIIPADNNEISLLRQYFYSLKCKLYHRLGRKDLINALNQSKSLLEEMQHHYIERYNDFLIQWLEKEKIINNELQSLIAQREHLNNLVKNTSFNERRNKVIFMYIPVSIYFISLAFASFVVFKNSSILIEQWKNLSIIS
ncbi:hypothetical protein KS876_001096 [Vibrio parahaemolyticus]|nr:hypothetical protein [Vibrio parahaemolyticus]ELA9431994.1 hypothetical protein [Vibrio parahaemolyticus]